MADHHWNIWVGMKRTSPSRQPREGTGGIETFVTMQAQTTASVIKSIALCAMPAGLQFPYDGG